MSNNDLIQRFLFESADVRGEFVRLEETLQQVLSRANYPTPIQSLLAESIGAAVLMSGTLKFDGRLVLQARGQGPVSTLVAECTHHRHVRALARWNEDDPLDFACLRDAMGDAQLAITIEPDKGPRYQGIVPMEKHRLQECLIDYFEQSEQLPTRVRLFTNGAVVGGLLLQTLPGRHRDDEAEDDWNRLCLLADTLTELEMLSLPIEQLIGRLFPEDDIRLFAPEPVQFGCTCSRERTLRALENLGKDEMYKLIEEQTIVTTDCQFCGQQYQFNRADMDALFKQHSLH